MDVHQRVKQLLPQIRSASAEIERDRRLPDALVAALRDAGLFRIAVPRSVGGLELHPWANVEIIEQIATADASTAWVCMIATGTSIYVSAFLDDVALAEVVGDDRIVVGFVGPRGVAVPRDGGYEVSGQWGWGSGSRHATWLASGCCVTDAEGLRMREDGGPEWLCAVLPASSCEIVDTWDTAGLRGTGSNDYVASSVMVPSSHTFSWIDRPRRETPLYRHRPMFLANMAGVPLGVARGALDDYRREVGSAAEHPSISSEYAKLSALVGSARSFLRDVIGESHDTLAKVGDLETQQAATLRLAISHAFTTCTEVVTRLNVLVGGNAIRKGHWLERRLRDVHTMNQHAHVGAKTYEPAGRMLLGLPPRIPLFV